MIRATCVVVPLLVVGSVHAQERPDEDAIFGGPSAPTDAETGTHTATATESAAAATPEASTTGPAATSTDAVSTTATATATTTQAGTDTRDLLNLGSPGAAVRFSSELAPEDPLTMGGQFYWRVMSTGRQGESPQDWYFSTPALLDLYLDARPNERVRAFVLGRMSYDPTQPPGGSAASSEAGASGGAPHASDSVSGLYGQRPRGPSVALDQLWLRFDVLRRVFVTAGKQHVRWGTARFWTPTDYMHMEARNPLLPFDPRTGTTMLKLHMPWEEKGWNFYAYALPESGTSATSRPADVAGALRSELVFGSMELGAGVFGRRNSKARFAADISFGVWDLDFYGEVAVRSAADIDFVHYQGAQCSEATAGGASDLTQYFTVARGSGWKAQATGGVSYTRKYADKDIFVVGAEYFYNGLGYSSVKDYLGLLALSQTMAMANPATFFYLGRQYLGVFASAPAPYSWDLHSFTLSSLANLSDQSGITRFDYSYTLLTHIRFEAYAAVHWGQRNGEFRLGFDSASLPCPPSEPRVWAPSIFDVGLGLRVAI